LLSNTKKSNKRETEQMFMVAFMSAAIEHAFVFDIDKRRKAR